MQMRDSASGKLLTFPARTLPPDSMEHWIDQILHTKDHLVDALEFLCTAYNEMLAGMPVRAIDEILAQIEAILKSDAALGKYTVVATVRTRRSRPAKPTQRTLLPFPSHGKRLI
jgi:hypothetical protein